MLLGSCEVPSKKMGGIGVSESLGKKNPRTSKSILYLACYAGTKPDTLYSATDPPTVHGTCVKRSGPMAMLILLQTFICQGKKSVQDGP